MLQERVTVIAFISKWSVCRPSIKVANWCAICWGTVCH